ncbi:MAG: ATP synthase F0 subunit B [Clostridiaceae bacterium]|nr:ATP synthase F0 subunit B [Clostridiaceae bacterium]
MELLELLEQIEDIVESGVSVPFSGGKCIVDREVLLDLIQEIRLKLPEDLKMAKRITEEKQRYLAEAQEEAQSIINNAESRIAALVDENEITKKAYEQAEIIIANAKKNAREIRLGTREYADSILNKVEEILEDTLDVIKVNRQELK